MRTDMETEAGQIQYRHHPQPADGGTMNEPQMCTVDDVLGPLAEPCNRVAQWEWQPAPDRHPVYLCNFHREPLISGPDLVSTATCEIRP